MFKYPVWNCTGHDINVLNRDGVGSVVDAMLLSDTSVSEKAGRE